MAEELHVEYRLSKEARQAAFVATGQMPPEELTAKFLLAEMTPAQRAVLAEQLGTGQDWDANGPYPRYRVKIDEVHPAFEVKMYGLGLRPELRKEAGVTYLEAVPTLEAVLELLAALPAREAEARAAVATDWEAALADWASAKEQARVEAEAEAKRQAEREARAAAEKAASEAERETWAEEHGSDHLRRAVAGGYNCARMYLIERAAQEYPDFVVDMENAGGWKPRSCPSVQALDLVDALQAEHADSLQGAKIVWLTKPPQDRKLSDLEADYEMEGWQEREGIVVRDAHYGKHDLVREL